MLIEALKTSGQFRTKEKNPLELRAQGTEKIYIFFKII